MTAFQGIERSKVTKCPPRTFLRENSVSSRLVVMDVTRVNQPY